MDVQSERAKAVAETVETVRAIEAEQGVTRAALADIRAALVALGRRAELFPEAEFPAPEAGGAGRLYLLSEDADNRLALYLNCAREKDWTPPHNHTTWAVVVGVRGEEHNKIYQTGPDDAVSLKEEVTIRPGTGVCLMPDDVHAISMTGPDVKMHLHMYGTAIPRQTGRKRYDAGGARVFAAHPDIRDARAGQGAIHASADVTPRPFSSPLAGEEEKSMV